MPKLKELLLASLAYNVIKEDLFQQRVMNLIHCLILKFFQDPQKSICQMRNDDFENNAPKSEFFS